MKSIILSLALSLAFCLPTRASDFDLAEIQKTINENSSLASELQVARVLYSYADLMGYLSKDLSSNMASSTIEILPEVEQMLNQIRHSQDPATLAAADLLRTKFAALVTQTNQLAVAVKNVGQQVVNMKLANEKFPEAQYAPTLNLMIALTQEYALNFENFAIELNVVATQMSDVQKLIQENSPEVSERMNQLALSKQSVEKYSFTEIGNRFKSISSVLKMIYQK